MNIREVNREIKRLIKINKFSNIYCHLEPFNNDIYFRLNKIIRSRPGCKETHNAWFDGLMVREHIASFRMVNAKKEDGKSFFRKNYIKMYCNKRGKNILKLIINYNVSMVYFEGLISI